MLYYISNSNNISSVNTIIYCVYSIYKQRRVYRMNELVLFSIRISDTARRKLRIIASYKDTSINAIIQKLLDKEISDWEQAHGVIEIPE